jgi:phytanoyl-CoA hydroxylase
MQTATGLSEAERASFEEQGFVLLRGVLSPQEAGAYRERLAEYAYRRRPVPEGVAVQTEPRVARGEVSAGDALESIRKIEWLVGHDEMFTQLAFHPRIVAVMQSLLGPDLKLFRDAVLMKPPHTGSPKGMHQDAPYWPIEPMNEVSCWMPFDRATLENGCMTVIPGSHRRGALPHVHVTDDYVVPREHYREEDIVAVPMEPGDGLVFHALLLHETGPNRSDLPRRAITLSYMPSSARYVGSVPKEQYVARMGGRSGFLRICGQDVPGGV